MNFDKNAYTVESLTVGVHTIRYRQFADLLYADLPANAAYQRMHIYAPEGFYEGESINGYTLATAPVFMPNQVGGYMPGEPAAPGETQEGSGIPNTVFCALEHGYVVAAPAIRGRVQQDENKTYTGKAPACIVDYKAAVRYLHAFAKDLPGDEEKIITNGTSAGGALSSLVGSSGNHPDYEPYLKAIGAADAGDGIFAASCYCPIINLEHADAAYEWQFLGVNEFRRMQMNLTEGGRPEFSAVDGDMTPEQVQTSKDEAALFPEYVNSLGLKDEQGRALTLAADGTGTFLEYVKAIVLESAQKALDRKTDLSGETWLTVGDGRAVGMDFPAYARAITRMKTAPAFDGLELETAENDLFGSENVNCRHFTKYSLQHSKKRGEMAPEQVVRILNPMSYVDVADAQKAKYFRIRHGECDRDTSLAISAMLVAKLRAQGCSVDYHAPWGVPHAGDYDLDELFAWIDEICRG